MFFLKLYNLLPKFYGLFIVIPLFIFYWFYLRKKVTKEYLSNAQTDELVKKGFDSSKLEEINNNKSVTIENIGFPQVEKIVQQFCNLYNKDKYKAIIRLSKKTKNSTILSFPYDITDELFFYLINYLNYPEGFNKNYHQNILGWTALELKNIKSNNELLGKK